MKLKSVSFENYKAFSEKQTMQLKPITVLIGKNSSGKSSIAKLFTLFENSLMGNIDIPLLLNNNGVELGGEFDNLFFENNPGGIPLIFNIVFDNDVQIEISLLKKADGYGLDIFQWKYKDNIHKFELELNDDGYFDAISKKIYNCEFKGFIPNKFFQKNSTENLSKNFEVEQIVVDYIGPFRILPERYFYLTGQTQFRYTGITGENAYAMLGTSKSKKDDELYKNVGKWYKDHFDGWELKVDDRDKKPLIQILLSKNDTDVNIVDVGQGMSQVLPLVVRANITDRPNSMIVIEQPELHLHPAAHGDLAELFAKSAKENNQTFIIETHSENMLLRLRKLIVENDFGFTKDDVIIYWLEDAEIKGKELMEITIDKDGVLSDWRDGVFDEGLKEVLEMQKVLKKKDEK
ncbi:AAA family ATPase [Nostoc sp.]|uniref:AAA family ATPase n=1 Tax=Nostoc sp. TaxID=1180 RepID=UPI002FF85FDF